MLTATSFRPSDRRAGFSGGAAYEGNEPHKESAVHDSDDREAIGQGAHADVSGWPPPVATEGEPINTSRGQSISGDFYKEEDGALKPPPKQWIMKPTAHWTQAMREAIRRSPDVALALILL